MGWQQVDTFTDLFFSEILLAISAICLVFLIVAIIFIFWAASLKKRYRKLMMRRDGLNLEELLNHYGELITAGQVQRHDFEQRLGIVEKQLVGSLAGVGLVRFNAFQETGSDLSFSIALLDRRQNGVVITSIFGREDSRCYGKPIMNGMSSHMLGEEEKKALLEAKRNMDL